MDTSHTVERHKISELDIPLARDLFLRNLISELAGALEEVIGLDEASGFISIVGQRIGDWMNDEYRRVCACDTLDEDRLAEVLVDLKRRIQGDFYVISEDRDKILLGNRRCPFDSQVKGHPSMCMMTSNVFGTVTAENLGYAKVRVRESIAQGADECRVVVYKRRCEEAEQDSGQEYYKS